jgi:hypothetical protein
VGVTTSDDQPLATLTPLKGIPLDTQRQRRRPAHREEPALWFVTITVSGTRMPPDSVREGLERLSEQEPFLVSAAYASSRAEVRYWDESMDIEGAVAQALRLWGDHEVSARLPAWKVVGLEVVDRDTARRRWAEPARAQVGELGEIRPMEGDDG